MTAASLAERARAANAITRFGPYVIHEQLGVGGMATVFRAERPGIGGFSKPVALKRLLSHLALDPAAVKSFTDEARLASHLHHANVVQTLDFGKVDNQYFIAMEYIAGPTLLQIMRQCESAAGAMPLAVVINILIQMCDGLDHAHNLCDERGRPLGIIHRDISPANIIVSNSGVVKLIDFGIAKVRDSQRTKAGVLKGKFAYIAPEYTVGHQDQRADLFALGIIAHELLTGRPLFQAQSDYETVIALREKPIQPPSRIHAGVPHDLDDIVMTALQRDPRQRWQSASAIGTALSNVARELKLPLGPQPLMEWVEWAFSQEPIRETSTLINVIDTLGESSVRLFPSAPVQSPFLDDESNSVRISFVEPEPSEATILARPKPKEPPPPVSPRLATASPPPPATAFKAQIETGVTVIPSKRRAGGIAATFGWTMIALVSMLFAAYYLGLAIDL